MINTNTIRAALIGVFATGSLSVLAAPIQQLTLTTTSKLSNTDGIIELTATFDSLSNSSLKITDPQNIHNFVFDKTKDILSQYGTVLPIAETDPNRTSLRVLVDRVKGQVSFTNQHDKRPEVVNQALALHAAFGPYWNDYNDFSHSNFIEKHKSPLYATLNFNSSKGVSRFFLCTALDYQANVTGTISLPEFIKIIMNRECTSQNANVTYLENALSLADTLIRHEAMEEDSSFYPNRWSPHEFSVQLHICENLMELEALREEGWIGPNQQDLTKDLNDCTNYLNKNVLSKIDEAMTLGMNSSVLKKNISPYYRKIVEKLLNDSGLNYLIDPKDIEKEVSQKVVAIFNIKRGFTGNKLDSSFFNTSAFLKAMEKKVDDPMSLITMLISLPESTDSQLRQEISQYPEEDQMAYIQSLLKTIGHACQPADYMPSCIYNSAMRLNTHQSRVTFSSGIDTIPVWSGFMFHSAHDTSDSGI